MLGAGGLLIMEKGVVSSEKGKAELPPGVRSSGVVVKGIFIGADFGMTSGLSGSSPLLDRGEGDLWSASCRAEDLSRLLLLGLGVLCGGDPSFWLPSSSFLLAVDKS